MEELNYPKELIENTEFVQFFIKHHVCWRCVLLMLKVDSLSFYRQKSFEEFEKITNSKSEEH